MKDCLRLVDGGFAINSPFPLILQPRRAVDLILSFDYSLEAPFQVRREAGVTQSEWRGGGEEISAERPGWVFGCHFWWRYPLDIVDRSPSWRILGL